MEDVVVLDGLIGPELLRLSRKPNLERHPSWIQHLLVAPQSISVYAAINALSIHANGQLLSHYLRFHLVCLQLLLHLFLLPQDLLQRSLRLRKLFLLPAPNQLHPRQPITPTARKERRPENKVVCKLCWPQKRTPSPLLTSSTFCSEKTHARGSARSDRPNLIFRHWGTPAGQLQLPFDFSKLALARSTKLPPTPIDKLHLFD